MGKASGPDGISSRVLKELADQMAMPLSLLFNQSIEDGKIPADWKEAYVSPVPKGGDLSLSSNYRPISLLSNLDKIFERAIFKHIYNHLRDNSILTAFLPEVTLNLILYGDKSICHENNVSIFSAVQKFIEKLRDFKFYRLNKEQK